MHFCKECHNMYYIRLAAKDNNKLIYYCRKCGDEEEIITEDNICVSKTFLKRGKQKFSNIINEYTKYDPTLPRVKNIPCPNEHCDEDDEKEIIYIRYDDIHMKYVYLCNACDTTWTMDNIN